MSANRSVLEGYHLEVLARARSLEARCAALLGHDYVSETPRSLAETIRNLARFLARAATGVFAQIHDPVDLEDERLLRGIDALSQKYAAHLRYIQGAQADRLPWNTIPALEEFFGHFAPKKLFLFRPKWHYNYTVTIDDFRDLYRQDLQEIAEFAGDLSIEEVLAPLSGPLHIIAFPALERENIVLHSLLGHELGHHFGVQYLTPERMASFERAIFEDVQRLTESQLVREGLSEKDAPLLWAEDRRYLLQENLRSGRTLYRRALDELLADAVCVILFGPAALLAMLEFALQSDLDDLPGPQTNHYPPWRYRLRMALELLQDSQNRIFPVAPTFFRGEGGERRAELVNQYVAHLKATCADTSDLDTIAMAPLVRAVYSQIPQGYRNGLVFLKENKALRSAQQLFRSKAFEQTVSALIERLDHQLPPNALHEESLEREPASIVAILNAASLFRLSLPTGDSERALQERTRADRLTLKAIEYSHLAANFRKLRGKLARQKPSSVVFGHQKSEGEVGLGVLSKPEILAMLRRPGLGERLVVTPLLDAEEVVSPSSIDVRLGNQFLIFQRESFPLLDVGASSSDGSLERYQERRILPYRRKFVLHPRQLVIGSTLEYVQMPPGLMAYVVGLSTWGRMGLIIATATKVDAGFRGCVTLEIINEGEVPLVLYPGLPIAQLVLHRTGGGEPYRGGYSCAIGPEFPDFQRKSRSWQHWLDLPR